MTQEEFYIWLLNCDSRISRFPEFDPKFLKNYEIAKLVLDKFGFHWLSENQQANLNFEAVSTWFRFSDHIYLIYGIPELLGLLPERIRGRLDLRNTKIQSLPELMSVERDLILVGSQIQALPKLESVGWDLFLKNSKIQSLPELKSIGGDLYLRNSQIESLLKLESVGGVIYVFSVGLNYWKNYFNETGRPHLAERIVIT